MAAKKDIEPDGLSNKRDVEPDGHMRRRDADDVEGHSMLISPSLGRDLQKARSQDIERAARSKQYETDAKRPNHK
jgi:hypothetical protein